MQKADSRVLRVFHATIHPYQLALGGGANQEEALKEYLRQRVQKAVRHLSATADVLAEVLNEIVELHDERMKTHEQIFRAASATRSEPRPGTRHRLLYLSLLLLALSTNCDVLQGAVPILGRLFPGISGKMDKQAELLVEVQDSLLRFADEYSMRMVGGVDNLRRGTDALSPAEVLHLKIAIPSQAISLRWRKWSTRRLLVIRFFGIHFISALTEEALLTFDHRDGRWC